MWEVFSFKFEETTFAIMCILAGCDYASKLHNAGIKSAVTFVEATVNSDILKEKTINASSREGRVGLRYDMKQAAFV